MSSSSALLSPPSSSSSSPFSPVLSSSSPSSASSLWSALSSSSSSSSPLQWSYQIYNCFTLLLSCIILCCVCLMHEMSRTASVLPHAFRMLRLRRRRLYLFEIDISSGAAARKVRMQYTWVLRTTVLVVGCYIWQTCILTFWAMDLQQQQRFSSSSRDKLLAACSSSSSNRRSADCFGMPHNYDFFSINANPDNLCTHLDELPPALLPQLSNSTAPHQQRQQQQQQQEEQQQQQQQEEQQQQQQKEEEFLRKYRYVTCVAFVKPDTIAVTQHLAIAFALANMIVTLFEVLVWLLYRTRSSWLPLLVLLVGVFFLATWIGSIFIPKVFTFFSSWIGYVMLLSTPVILWTALLAAHNLRKIQHQKLELWKKQANRPMAESDDPTVGAAVANAGAPLLLSGTVNGAGDSVLYHDKLGGGKPYFSASVLSGVNPLSRFSVGRPTLSPFLARFQTQQQRGRGVGAAREGRGGRGEDSVADERNGGKKSSEYYSPTSYSTSANDFAGRARMLCKSVAGAPVQLRQRLRVESAAAVPAREQTHDSVAGESRAETAAGLAPASQSNNPNATNEGQKTREKTGSAATTTVERTRAAPSATIAGGGTASTAGGSVGKATPRSNKGNGSETHTK